MCGGTESLAVIRNIEQVYPRVCGGTESLAVIRNIEQVYPRVCGGTRDSVAPQSSSSGLSPRVRGNL